MNSTCGLTFTQGRESNRAHGETFNGQQIHATHQFSQRVDPYLIPGDPASGLLPGIDPDSSFSPGASDARLPAYNFRVCMTRQPEKRIPFFKPDGYDRAQYELLARYCAAGGVEDPLVKFDRIQNYKTDTNNHGPFSTDFIGMNYDYPEASYEERAKIIKAHEDYQKGLMYFLANDPKVPEEVRTRMAEWGLAKDEFTDNSNWPHQLYIREARRMIGEYVMTEHDTFSEREIADPVGMGSYTLDSHNVQRYIKDDGYVQNEGDIGVHPKQPYQISYGSLVPKKEECGNLLVPVCVSSSHIAFGSIRMEPVFMILGQSAAAAAVLAIDKNSSVQEVDYTELKSVLDARKQVLSNP